jgi:hypothetical protein
VECVAVVVYNSAGPEMTCHQVIARNANLEQENAAADLRRQRRLVISAKAGDGTRTRDIQLGKLTLYQLSYTRWVGRHCSIRPR